MKAPHFLRVLRRGSAQQCETQLTVARFPISGHLRPFLVTYRLRTEA